MGDADNNLNLAEHGQCIILPSSFVGSEHFMTQLFQDAMAIVRTFGKPDIFLTMTANPNWPEIQDQLLWQVSPGPGANHQRRRHKASDRPDIVTCVFEQKKNALLKEINNGKFGRVIAIFHTIEFQKCSLPHMHCLIFLHPDDKICDTNQVDNFVSAQLPDQIENPLLYETITTCMLHGPVETKNVMHLAWSMESVASIIQSSLTNTQYMERTVILSMPGQTMVVQ